MNRRDLKVFFALIDYKMGNLSSVNKALEASGATVRIVTTPAEAEGACALVLPGVGSFGDAMANLNEAGWSDFIRSWIAADRPFLGICLGMQMLLESSEESPGVPGLGIFPGTVRRFPDLPGSKVPHMGWNTVRGTGSSPFFSAEKEAYFYFVHSFYLDPLDRSIVAAETDYLLPFPCAIARGRLLATQFHPEKSQETGLDLLKKFVRNITTEEA